MITMKQAQEIQQQRQDSLVAYEPRSFDDAMRMALVFAQSGLLGEIRSQEAALLIMATGAELGIPATTALRGIYIVKGKPILSSDLIVALCLKRKDLCEYFICVESTDRLATYETKRVGVPTPVRNTFTIEDATRAKLGLEWDKQHSKMVPSSDSNWSKYPKAMLRHRASSELARQVYPDIVLGLYTQADEDELRGEAIDVTPTQLVTQPIRVDTKSEPQPTESLADAVKRWKGELSDADTIEDCDKVRHAAKARGVSKGMAEYDVIAKAWSERVNKIKTAAKCTPPLEPAIQEADVIDKVKKTFGDEVVVEREPGSDDA